MEYKEKLRLAKEALDSGSYDKETIEYIFPELAESEDEKNKRILRSISSKMSLHLRDIFTEEEFQCYDAWSNAWLEEQGEQKPDKVEPKFHEGDWVVFNNKHQSIYQVEKIEDGYYILRHTHGGTFRVCVLHDESIRLWTIQDAKDGDVLACESGWTCIFKKFNHNSFGGLLFDSHCFIDRTGWFCDGAKGHTLDKRINGKIYPATKEQRGLLFQKMHEAGYEWDAEKKALKKIEQKTTEWSEEDEKIYQSIMDDTVQENQLDGKQTDWLRNIKYRHFSHPQSQWKPSDAQMEALRSTVENIDMMQNAIGNIDNFTKYYLTELLEQLKAL